VVVAVADRAERREPTAEELEAQADAVADFVEDLLSRMGVDGIAEPVEEHGRMYVDVVDAPEPDLALLIGRQGQTLDAIQELSRQIVSRQVGQRIRVIVDVQDYRKRRDRELTEHARAVAEDVAAEGGERELEPMNALERKLVHDAVADVEGVETLSRGEEPDRFVVIRRV
jgi:spoIIIJ-associated protein